MDIKVSVIIPVYNVEKTLNRCIDSILNQTLKEIEVILVDDGSTDRSSAICDDYEIKYEKISVIHKENEGLGPTRNAGTAIARGEYIYHCDSDDWVDLSMLENVYLNAKRNNADAVIFGYKIFTEKDGNLKKYGVISSVDQEFNTKDEIQNFFISNLNNAYIAQSACNRIIKRTFLGKNQIQFKPYRRCQDIMFSLDLFDHLQTLNVVSQNYYNYIIEPGTYKGRNFKDMIGIYLDVYKEMLNHFSKWGKCNESNEKVLSNLNIANITNYASFYVIKKAQNRKITIIRELIEDSRVQQLFCSIKISDIKSRFIKMSYYAIMKKNPTLLLFVFILHELRQGSNK